MFIPTNPLLTDDNAFLFVDSKTGTPVPFINYELIMSALRLSGVGTNQVISAFIDAKLELLEYRRGH